MSNIKNITESGLEQVNYKKGSIIYKINEKSESTCDTKESQS